LLGLPTGVARRHARVSAQPFCVWQLNIHDTPYASTSMPNFAPQNVSCSGIVILPPADSASRKRFSAAASAGAEDDAALIGGIRAGARGFLLKGTTPDTLVEAIRTVAAGGTFLHAALTPSTDVADMRVPPLSAADPLTAREREVLSLMTNGLANTQIAAALKLGEGTVRNHVSSILAKLGVSDRTKAVLVALRQRLV